MAIHVRMAAEYNRAFSLGIERISDNAQFNFTTGAFDTATSPMRLFPFIQDSKTPGRYTIEAPHQKLLQFNSDECCFWLFRSNGEPAPNNLETVWLESGTVTVPFTLDYDLFVVSITEPSAAF